MDKKKKHVTAKRKKVIMLPEIRDHIIQPNRITNAVSDYTLYQERVFTAIVYYLQNPIKLSFNGENYKQLDLFGSDMVMLNIPLKDISSPREYPKVKESIRQMSSMNISIKYKDKDGKARERTGGLFIADMPESGNGRGIIRVKFDPMVADLIIRLDRNARGQAINYTRFAYQIAQGVKTKYAAKLYKLISSWKSKGGFYMSKDELYTFLGVDGKYARYADFKRRVLMPAHEELYEKSDCWFNCRAKDFEERNGNEVVGFNFKVITPEFLEDGDKKVEQIISLLKTHFKCTDDDIEKISPIFSPEVFNYGRIVNKIQELSEKVDHSIKQKNRYVITSLVNEFLK